MCIIPVPGFPAAPHPAVIFSILFPEQTCAAGHRAETLPGQVYSAVIIERRAG